tara:strand:- start:318 stop:509 length:192 start_codon:yes stop_codon:yes gene_type:complete
MSSPFEEAIKAFGDEIQNLKNILGDGSPESYDQYKHIVGTIRGIEWARQELITIIKNINQEEE